MNKMVKPRRREISRAPAKGRAGGGQDHPTGPAGSSEDAKALQYAIRRLAIRDHGCAELKLNLQRKGFSGPAVAKAIETCIRKGYLDDQRFAAALAAAQGRKGFGPAKLRALLRGKGLDRETIEQTLEQCFGRQVQLQAAFVAVSKKLRSSKVKSQADPRPLLWRYLQGRGFPGSLIAEVFASVKFDEMLMQNKGQG